MRIFVPDTKTILTLKKPWTFTLFDEYRNMKFIENMGLSHDKIKYYYQGTPPSRDVTLPAGTVLRVDRVYIRQGTSETYDSLTFVVKECPKDKKIKGRFWAKLSDVNTMDVDISNYVPEIKFKIEKG